jgi:hypothetical protein
MPIDISVHTNEVAAAVIQSRRDKYNLFNTPVSRSEFMSVFTLENAPLVLSLMREAYRFDRDAPPQRRPTTSLMIEDAAPRESASDDLEDDGSDASDDDFQKEETSGCNGIKALRKMIKICEDINFSSYRESPSDAIPGKEYLMPNPNPLLAEDRMDVMRKCLGPNASVMDEAFWLVCFGVPIPDIVRMHQMVRLNSSAVRTYLFDLYTNHREVYATLFTYFQLLDENALFYEVDGDLYMWMRHTQAAASHYHLQEGEEIPPVVGRVLACDNCRDIKHASFYFRLVKAQINGSGKILTTATCLYCAKEPKAANWQDQYVIDHHERALGASMTLCGPSKFMIGAPVINGENLGGEDGVEEATPEVSTVYRRKFGKFISTQIKLHKCADKELRVLTILGRFTVYDGIVYTGCYNCLRFSALEDLIYYGADILCEDCVQEKLNELARASAAASVAVPKAIKPSGSETALVAKSKPKQARITCAYCSKDITSVYKKMMESESKDAAAMGGNVKSFFLLVDTIAKPEFRTVYFCASHNNLRWVTQYSVPFLSVVMRGIRNKWGMRNADGTVIPVGPLRDAAGYHFAMSPL